ncbi:MAG: tetratricopeptide repeat protein [Flavobacteriales bacterium]|nr:tetratricopeptide repeat protein [Flavobacteriales bacterium]
MKKLFVLFYFGFCLSTLSLAVDVDELKQKVDTVSNDTLKVKLLEQLCWKYLFSEPEIAQEYADKGLELAKKIGYDQGAASIYSDLGILNDYHNNYAASLENYDKALQIDIKDGDEKGEARIYNNLGIFYKNRGELDVAIDYFIKSLAIKEKHEDRRGISSTKLGVGNIYYNREDYKTALNYYQESYNIDVEINNRKGIGTSANNVGLAFYELKELDSADFYYKIAEVAALSEDNFRDQSNCYNNIGLLNLDRNNLELAQKYFEKSYQIDVSLEDRSSMTAVLLNISRVYSRKKNYEKSLELINQALKISVNIEDLYGQIDGYDMLSADLYLKGDYKKAYEYKDEYILLKDSIKLLENEEHIENLNAKYESDKKELQIDALNKDKQVQELEIKKQNLQKIAFAIGFGLMLILAVVIFRSLKQKQRANFLIIKQKKEVELQKNIVEEKNQEILDSITYAKRIQSAILPSTKVVKEYLQESFILYKPKDIVAGDFYWLEQREDKVLFAAADCTGHGVPGAMVSVVCNNALNRSVREHALTDPGEILNKTREIVIQEFEKSDEVVQDGMDIALCSLEGNTLKYAGAHNPLWIIRNGEILETKANKQPIGKFDNPEPYITHSFELQKGDSIYIFSDGYVDQFGGEKGKKFKSRAFRELLLSIQDKDMEEQKIIIDNSFETWKGDLEQIDDVCIIGVRI